MPIYRVCSAGHIDLASENDHFYRRVWSTCHERVWVQVNELLAGETACAASTQTFYCSKERYPVFASLVRLGANFDQLRDFVADITPEEDNG